MGKNNIVFGLIFSIIIGFFSIDITNGYSCEYTGKISECLDANDSGTSKSIDSFVCNTTKKEESIAYQVVLDGEFGKIDKEMDKYIENLEKTKNMYFGINKQKTYIDGINDIEDIKKNFKRKYSELCGAASIDKEKNINSIPYIVASCLSKEKTSNENAKMFLNSQNSICTQLVNKKMEIYDDITFAVLMMNKQQIKADEKKTYDQGERRNYNKLLDIMMINLGYLERIWQKFPSFTKNTL